MPLGDLGPYYGPITKRTKQDFPFFKCYTIHQSLGHLFVYWIREQEKKKPAVFVTCVVSELSQHSCHKPTRTELTVGLDLNNGDGHH